MPDSDFYERMIEQLSYQELGDMLDSQIELRKVAEKMAREARDELERVAIALVPAQVDDYRYASPEGIGVLDIAEIAELLVSGVQEKLQAVPDREALREKHRAITRLREENRKLKVQVRVLEARVERLKQAGREEPGRDTGSQAFVTKPRGQHQERSTATGATADEGQQEKAIESVTPVSPVAVISDQTTESGHQSAGQGDSVTTSIRANRREGPPPWMAIRPHAKPVEVKADESVWPEWVRDWRLESGNFSRDCDVIAVMGDTGLALRQSLAQHLARWWKLGSVRTGSVGRAFGRTESFGLVEIIKPDWQKLSGVWRVRQLVCLTGRGEDAYRLLRGRDPVHSQATELLGRHKSPEHAALNIKAAELMWRAGYEVEIFPEAVPGEGWTYRPDLRIGVGERSYYVECERMTHYKSEDEKSWQRKWEICCQASGGHLCVVTATRREMQQIKDRLLDWVGTRSFTLWTASIEELKASEDEVWTFTTKPSSF
jgi:hypothetical protein